LAEAKDRELERKILFLAHFSALYRYQTDSELNLHSDLKALLE